LGTCPSCFTSVPKASNFSAPRRATRKEREDGEDGDDGKTNKGTATCNGLIFECCQTLGSWKTCWENIMPPLLQQNAMETTELGDFFFGLISQVSKFQKASSFNKKIPGVQVLVLFFPFISSIFFWVSQGWERLRLGHHFLMAKMKSEQKIPPC